MVPIIWGDEAGFGSRRYVFYLNGKYRSCTHSEIVVLGFDSVDGQFVRDILLLN